MKAISARALKVTAVLDPSELAALPVPASARVVLQIKVGARIYTADIATKALRKSQATIMEHGADAVVVLIQGKLDGEQIVEAGLTAQPRVVKVAAA
jgi:hypothetical protein